MRSPALGLLLLCCLNSVSSSFRVPSPPRPSRRLCMSLPIGDDVALSSRRCAGARYLYENVVGDPLAPVLAGDDIIESERVNQKNNAVYPVVAVRTRWMDDQIKAEIGRDPTFAQVVLCGAGMDARAYRLSSLSACKVFELDIKQVLDYKAKKIASVADRFPLLAKSVERIDSDFSDDVTWLQRLKASGFDPKAKTIWILEGFLYYFELDRATRMLKAIQQNSGPGSVLLADHINDYTLASLKAQAANKWLTSTFSSSMESPEDSLQQLGFKDVHVLTVGEEPANYGIWSLPVVPREENKEIMRTYLFSTRTA